MSTVYEDDDVDQEAAARFWGAPRFGAASTGGHSAAPQAAAYSERGRGDGDGDIKGSRSNGDDVDDEEESLFESEPEPVSFPESTHTLFFMFPVCSIPFFFATCIGAMSAACLSMALINTLESNSSPGNPLGVPVNVTTSVKIAPYLGILIAVLMEEEIPTGLQLLRVIPSTAFKSKFPSQSYKLFVASAMLRIGLGLLFLVNAYFILIQSTSVLDIFFNVLALQFISELDDIAFSLAKMDVMGARLRRACTARLYQTEFEKQSFRRSRMASIFLKSIYILELAGFLVGMTIITLRQNEGHYQCQEITVDFGDGIWEDPVLAPIPGVDFIDLPKYTLVFSYFNGVYKQLNKETENGRPVYTEMKKFDSTEYDDLGFGFTILPAKIKYSDDAGSWIFTHSLLRQQSGAGDDDETWLLRSPQTDDFELQSVDGEWDIWLGRIQSSRVKISCNKCYEDADCNFNGVCGRVEEGKCDCNKVTNRIGATTYLGTFCEIKLEDKCETIVSEEGNVIYGVNYIPAEILQTGKESNERPDGDTNEGTLFQEYNRPVYTHLSGFPGYKEGDILWLIYTGRRWFGMGFNLIELNATFEDVYIGTANFHAFWSNAYSESTSYVSDPTTGDNPVGVDFYLKGEVNNKTTNQFGPFGALYPLQKDGLVGRGLWRCAGSLNNNNTTGPALKSLNSTQP